MAAERRLGPRFGPEAGLILAAAAFAALLELSWPGVIVVVLCAWLAVAIFEIVRAHVRPSRNAEPTSPRPQPEQAQELSGVVRPRPLEPVQEPRNDFQAERTEREPERTVAAAPPPQTAPTPEQQPARSPEPPRTEQQS